MEVENDKQVEKENSEEKKIETKNQKKKKRKKRRQLQKKLAAHKASLLDQQEDKETSPDPDIEIEYVTEPTVDTSDPQYQQFSRVFEAFKLREKGGNVNDNDPFGYNKNQSLKGIDLGDDDSDDEGGGAKKEEETIKLSKKRLRRMSRMSVAQLKQVVERPDLVEMHDVSALDPTLLIYLKACRNTVQVPRHWCFKRKYLQGKRGIEKPPFNLPDFIKATGIMEMRSALEDKEDNKSLKQKTRERVRPKLGKLTIDYQKLHDAFFKWQTKPHMTIHGDLYYEGKEFETRLRDRKPGDLTDDLRIALGMPIGPGKHKFPPPWLIAMQRYGPPPSYPNLKIAGLNAPIPEGCSFGYFVGGWGKPPVDEMGRPLYGDVFGMNREGPNIGQEEEIDNAPWGELESSEEEEEEEEESDDEKEGADEIQPGMITPMEGLVTPSGLTSIPAGIETPEMIQLRKKKIEEAMEQGGDTPSLYTVLPEKESSVGGAMMGSSHVYDIASTSTSGNAPKLRKEDISKEAPTPKNNKRKKEEDSSSKSSKKLREFKF